MGDIGDEFRAFREFQKERKWTRYEEGKQALIDNNINFVEKDNGHFIIGDYDFWGTTGLFIHRKTKRRGNGIALLLKKIASERTNNYE